jgi:hypothetical protein
MGMLALQSVWAERSLTERPDVSFDDWYTTTVHGLEIYRTSRMLGAEAGYSAAAATGEALTQAMMAWQTARFRLSGRHTFSPSPGLAQQLLLTELRGIKGRDLQLPFPTVYLEVPEQLGFKTISIQTGWHPVTGAYVAADEHEGMRGLRLLLTARGITDDVHDDALSHFFMPLFDDEPIAKTLADVFTSVQIPKDQRAERNLPQDDEGMEREAHMWVDCFRWVMNLLFYTTSPVAEREHIEANPAARKLWQRIQKMPSARNKKRAKLVVEHKKLPKQPRIVLGRSVKLNRTMPTAVDEVSAASRSELKVRTLVSGHWQRFASGKGRTERVWKFRAPFWRGSSEAPKAEVTAHKLGDGDD